MGGLSSLGHTLMGGYLYWAFLEKTFFKKQEQLYFHLTVCLFAFVQRGNFVVQ